MEKGLKYWYNNGAKYGFSKKGGGGIVLKIKNIDPLEHYNPEA